MNDHPAAQSSQNHIHILKVIKEAWALVRGLKWPVFLLLILFPIASHVLALAVLFLLIPHSLFLSILVICSVNVFFIWICLAMISIIGVRHSIDLPLTLNLIIKQSLAVKDKLFYLFLIWACTLFAFLFLNLFLLPGGTIGILLRILLYVGLIYVKFTLLFFAVPLAIIKQTELSTLLEESYQAMNRHWVQIIVCTIIMSIIITISAIPLGIGLIWTLPMYCAMTGILFRDIYGLKKRPLQISPGL